MEEFLETEGMRRLKDVGMHCGCEYTSFPLFRFAHSYSRWLHSAGHPAAVKKYGLHTEEVVDYHLYPEADNPAPALSADRLEYILGNFYCGEIKSRKPMRISRLSQTVERQIGQFNNSSFDRWIWDEGEAANGSGKLGGMCLLT